jgi:hypothetical protein
MQARIWVREIGKLYQLLPLDITDEEVGLPVNRFLGGNNTRVIHIVKTDKVLVERGMALPQPFHA